MSSDTCPRCGAPGIVHTDGLPAHACRGYRDICEYAAGLRGDNAALARKLLIRDSELDAMAERAERAEAALQEIADRIGDGYGVDRPVDVVNDVWGTILKALEGEHDR